MRITGLDIEAIEEASKSLNAKRDEIDHSIKDFDAKIECCRGTGSPRLNRDVDKWEDIRNRLNGLLPSLTDTAQELLQAAIANERANE